MEDIVRTLEFTYQSLTKCFTPAENHSSLDHFFILFIHRLINIKDSFKDTDAKKNLLKSENSTENIENFKFRSAFSIASFIQLPRDAQIQIDAALSEMEAMDYRDWVYLKLNNLNNLEDTLVLKIIYIESLIDAYILVERRSYGLSEIIYYIRELHLS